MIELDLLQTLAVVVDSGNFTRAAYRLDTTQSTISAKIKRLEKQIGRPVLSRTTREMTLTADGEAALDFARQALQIQQSAYFYFSREAPDIQIRLGLSADLGDHEALFVLLEGFRAQHPSINLSLHFADEVALAESFRLGDLDLMLTFDPVRSGRHEPLWTEELVWAAAESFDLGEGGLHVPLVLGAEGGLFRQHALSALREARISRQINYCSSSLETLKALVARGHGATVLPRRHLTGGLTELRHPDLPELPLAQMHLERRRAICAPAEKLGAQLRRLADPDLRGEAVRRLAPAAGLSDSQGPAADRPARSA